MTLLDWLPRIGPGWTSSETQYAGRTSNCICVKCHSLFPFTCTYRRRRRTLAALFSWSPGSTRRLPPALCGSGKFSKRGGFPGNRDVNEGPYTSLRRQPLTSGTLRLQFARWHRWDRMVIEESFSLPPGPEPGTRADPCPRLLLRIRGNAMVEVAFVKRG